MKVNPPLFPLLRMGLRAFEGERFAAAQPSAHPENRAVDSGLRKFGATVRQG
jgi:hypothetical protein